MHDILTFEVQMLCIYRCSSNLKVDTGAPTFEFVEDTLKIIAAMGPLKESVNFFYVCDRRLDFKMLSTCVFS